MSTELKKKMDSPQQEAALKAYNDIMYLESRLESLIEHGEERHQARMSFGFAVLSSVAQGNYQRALNELEVVGDSFTEYALFKIRTSRHVEHAKSLVAAIRIKHMIGRSAYINKSKQKELSDKIADHFLDLKRTIMMIEKIQKSVRAEDLGSTIFFVKTIFYSLTLIVFIASGLYAYEYLDVTLEQLFSFEWPD